MSDFQGPARLDVAGEYPIESTIVGQVHTFEDIDYSSTDTNKPRLSGMPIKARLCVNRSGGTLTPGLAVAWSTDANYEGPGRAIGGAADANTSPAGFVSPYSGTIAENTTFWLIEEGPTKVQYDGSANFAFGDQIGTAASGRVLKWVTSTNPVEARCGRALENKASGSAGDLIRAYVFAQH